MMITTDIEMWHMFIGIMIINVVQVFHSQNNNNNNNFNQNNNNNNNNQCCSL